MIAEGDATAVYCSGCNPSKAGIMVPSPHGLGVIRPERILDVADYMNQPISERLEDANRTEAL